MKSNFDSRSDASELGTLINKRMEKICEIKESLKRVPKLDDEIEMLRSLTLEITELRDLRERHFSRLNRRTQATG